MKVQLGDLREETWPEWDFFAPLPSLKIMPIMTVR